MHGKAATGPTPANRMALQLAGVGVGELERGDQLVEEGAFAASKVLAAKSSCCLASPLAGVLPVRLHLLAC